MSHLIPTADRFIARLSEAEKGTIREAKTADRLHWLFHNRHVNEVDEKIFNEAVVKMNEIYAINSQSDVFGRTWAF